MADTVIAPRYQMRYEQLVNTPVLDRIPYFHDREIEYILEVSKAEAENAALKARLERLSAPVSDEDVNGLAMILAMYQDYQALDGRVVELEQQLAALTWTEITPDNPPKPLEDEVLRSRLCTNGKILYDVDRVGLASLSSASWNNLGYFYRRPINPPPPSGAKGETIVFQENINE